MILYLCNSDENLNTVILKNLSSLLLVSFILLFFFHQVEAHTHTHRGTQTEVKLNTIHALSPVFFTKGRA